VTIAVECWDGASHETTITVDFTDTYQGYADRDDLESFLDDMEDLIFDEAADEAEEFVARACRSCKGTAPNV
jgi:hypothetical protein